MAAGQGFKTFVTGEVLTAGDVNGYLMQGINVFTNATARDAAITAPAEGQFAFTKDNNSLWYYDGAVWVASGATGDIEGVTAGVGISGGGTSGTVTITNSMATAIDAKGDLVAGTGADAFDRLAVGSNGTVLTADSTTATGLKWAAAVGGKILQVVQATTSTAVSTSTGGVVATGLEATITPSSATSKVLILVSQPFQISRQTGITDFGGGAGLYRASTLIFGTIGNQGAGYLYLANHSGTAYLTHRLAWNYLDSPATTSATTYSMKMVRYNADSVVTAQGASLESSIILLEVAA